MTAMTHEEALEHFGTKGMKWGVRKGKGSTGLTRHRGALIDQNSRRVARLQKAQAGKKYRLEMGIGKAIFGKETMQRQLSTQIKELNAQNNRLKSGKLVLNDRLGLVMNVRLEELVISRKPQ